MRELELEHERDEDASRESMIERVSSHTHTHLLVRERPFGDFGLAVVDLWYFIWDVPAAA
jgi:hypothetical protein